MKNPFRRIIITGPESSGKSTLANALGETYGWPVLGEYAVEYLQKYGPSYDFDDLIKIAKGQHAQEEDMLIFTNKPVICDTSMLVMHIWSQVRFGKTDPKILKWLDGRKGEVFLLCKPDIDWEPGPFRENPDDRELLYEKYNRWLRDNDCRFCVISGSGNQRLNTATAFIESELRLE